MQNRIFHINENSLNYREILNILNHSINIDLHDDLKKKIDDNHKYLCEYADINPKHFLIPSSQLSFLQSLIQGFGKPFSPKTTKLILLCKILEITKVKSGISFETILKLIEAFNKDIIPLIPEKTGSSSSEFNIGLAYLIYGLMGKTKIYDRKKGEYVEGEEIFKERNYNVLKLKDCELQGLLSGNRLMLGQSIEILEEAEKLFKNSLKIFSVSFDALVANPAHFYDKINDVRHHKGQIKIAEEIRYNIYENGELSERHEYFKDKQRLQDSYSFRCVSQIKGIIWEMLDFFKNIVDNEINNVSTVPLVLNEEKDKEVIFGGNFCDFSLVQAVDMLNMGLNEIGSISDRRINRLNNPELFWGGNIDKYLNVRFNYQNIQSISAVIVGENKILAQPGSLDVTPFRQNQGDFYSNGNFSVRKSKDLMNNVRKILAIELYISSTEILEKENLKSTKIIQSICEKIKECIVNKESLGEKIDLISNFLEENEF